MRSERGARRPGRGLDGQRQRETSSKEGRTDRPNKVGSARWASQTTRLYTTLRCPAPTLTPSTRCTGTESDHTANSGGVGSTKSSCRRSGR